jgi:hypothetical protein
MPASFSPCGRRCRSEAQADEGFSPRRQTPYPSRCRFAPIADTKRPRPFFEYGGPRPMPPSPTRREGEEHRLMIFI